MPRPNTVTGKQIHEMIKRQRFRCALTNRELTPETASLDHIIPLSRDGEHDITNLWVVDHQANASKGTLLVEEFVALCRDVVKHAGRHGEPENADCSERVLGKTGFSEDARGNSRQPNQSLF